MARLTKETKEKIKEYIFNCLDEEDYEEQELKTEEEKLKFTYSRFKSEFDHEIKRQGEFKAFSCWLSGLALSFDYMNADILKLAKEWGQDISTESKQDKILNQWWDFLTNQFFKLIKHYKINNEVC